MARFKAQILAERLKAKLHLGTISPGIFAEIARHSGDPFPSDSHGGRNSRSQALVARAGTTPASGAGRAADAPNTYLTHLAASPQAGAHARPLDSLALALRRIPIDWSRSAKQSGAALTYEVEAKFETHPLLIAARRAFGTSDRVSIVEAAAILGVSLRTARRRQAAGLMPPRRRVIRTWKYERADVVQLRDRV